MSSSRGRKPARAHHQLLDSRLSAHLWSPAHISKVIIKRDSGLRQKDQIRGPKDLQKCQAMPEASWKAKNIYFFHHLTKTQNSGDRVWEAVSQKS